MVTNVPDPILKALADPVRREIVEHLAAGPMTVRPLAARFAISRPAISRHLRILREAGVLEQQPSGRENRYAVRPDALRELSLWLRSLWTGRLGALKTLVEQETP